MTYMLWFSYNWFKFCFCLFQTHYHTMMYVTIPKNKGNQRIQIKDKIEPKHIQPCLFEAENVDILRSMTFPGIVENKFEELSQSRIGVPGGNQWIKALYL